MIYFYLFLCYVQKNKRAHGHLKRLLEGNPQKIDRNRSLQEQATDLLYDKRWEFPFGCLRLGN